MHKLGRILGIVGFVLLLSVPLTVFVFDYRFTWTAFVKLAFGTLAISIWLGTNFRKIRETFQGRSTFYQGFAALFVTIVLVSLVIVNYLLHKHPYQIDLTTEQVFTLSDQTVGALAELEEDVRVMAFYGPREAEYDVLQDILERYRYASTRFVYEFVDPLLRQDLVQRYKIHHSGPRLLVHYRDLEKRIRLGDKDHSGPEEAITAAVLQITARGVPRKVCFLTGHGEKATKGEDDPRNTLSLLVKDLAIEGFATDMLSLLEQPEVPEACRLVILAGPANDLVGDELDSLKTYLDSGGRLMAFLGKGDSTSVDPLLRQYGVELRNESVIYPKSRSPLEVVSDPRRYPKTHPVFARFFSSSQLMLEQLQAVFPLARPVKKAIDPPEGLQAVELVASTPLAWGESDVIQGSGQIQLTFEPDQDLPGPVPMAVTVASRSDGMRLAVFGSSLLAVDAAWKIYPFNRNLVMNTLAWLVHEEKKITIRPRYRAASLLRLDYAQLKFITFFALDLLPLLILAFGITVWQIRRKS